MSLHPDRVVVIDGGFATQLSVHVGDRVDGDPLWSARFNATNPSAVFQTHLDFLRAGAECILTNTYQASVEGYMRHLQLDREQSVALIRKAVELAQEARVQWLKESGRERDAQGESEKRVWDVWGEYSSLGDFILLNLNIHIYYNWICPRIIILIPSPSCWPGKVTSQNWGGGEGPSKKNVNDCYAKKNYNKC